MTTDRTVVVHLNSSAKEEKTELEIIVDMPSWLQKKSRKKKLEDLEVLHNTRTSNKKNLSTVLAVLIRFAAETF